MSKEMSRAKSIPRAHNEWPPVFFFPFSSVIPITAGTISLMLFGQVPIPRDGDPGELGEYASTRISFMQDLFILTGGLVGGSWTGGPVW